MKIAEFLSKALNTPMLNTTALARIESKYGIIANEEARRICASAPMGMPIFFDDECFYKLLSLEEILDASTDMNVDFVSLGIVPIIDAGENDYISYDRKENVFCRFNIAEEFKYAKKQSINQCFN